LQTLITLAIAAIPFGAIVIWTCFYAEQSR